MLEALFPVAPCPSDCELELLAGEDDDVGSSAAWRARGRNAVVIPRLRVVRNNLCFMLFGFSLVGSCLA
jgi:hypothetical protein